MDIMSVLSELEQVCDDLSQAHRELAEVEAAAAQARVNAWENSQESTVTGRGRDADILALPLTVDAIKLKGEIAALRERKHYLTVALEV